MKKRDERGEKEKKKKGKKERKKREGKEKEKKKNRVIQWVAYARGVRKKKREM